MAFKDRLKEARLNIGMTQEQVAKEIGVAKSTFTGYEKGNSEPNMLTISKIMNVLNVDANFLWQDEMDELGGSPMQLKYEEMKHLEKYRFIQEYYPRGAETVNYILDQEHKEAQELKERFEKLAEQAELISDRDKRIAELESSAKNIINIGTYTEHLLDRTFEYHHSASAGSGVFMLDDEGVEQVAIPAETPGADKCDYLIKISGNSMEPDYYDGEVALVSRIMPVRHGDVGIFVVDGKAYIKEYGDTELISRNPSSENIKISEYANIVCMGKVVGKIREEDIVRK